VNLKPYNKVCAGRDAADVAPTVCTTESGKDRGQENPEQTGTELVVNWIEAMGLRRKTHGAMNILAVSAHLRAERPANPHSKSS